MKYVASLLTFVVVTWLVAPGSAQAGSGFYVSSEIGANFASGFETIGSSNDRASVCDEFINDKYDMVEDSGRVDADGVPYSTYNCMGPNRGGVQVTTGRTSSTAQRAFYLEPLQATIFQVKSEQPLGRPPRGVGILLPAIEL